jgi:hypothetical protein
LAQRIASISRDDWEPCSLDDVCESQRLQLPLVALRLSEEQQEKAEGKAKHRASKKQCKVRSSTLDFSGWVLGVTTLPQQSWSDQQILRLSQARWPSELLGYRASSNA